MQKKIKVLQVVGAMYPGGIENFIMGLYKYMDPEKVQFDFAVHARREGDYGPIIEQMGGRIFEVGRFTRHPIKSLKTLKKLIKEEQYDVVVRHTPNAMIVPQLMVARHAGAVTVCHSHSTTDPNMLLHKIGRLLINKYTDYPMACSVAAGKWMYKKHDFKVVNNAIDIKKFEYSPEKAKRIREEFNIGDAKLYGNIANLLECKNQLFAIDVFAKILEEDPDARFIFVGEGEMRPLLTQKIKDMHLEDKVILAGMRSDVPDIMSAMDVMLFPSIFEGLPLTLIEAQASGLPSLISDKITDDVIVTNGVIEKLGIEKSPQEWAKKALKMGGIDREDRKDEIRNQIKSKGYDIEELAREYTEFFSACNDANNDSRGRIMFHINSLGRGGAERVVSILTDALCKAGYDIRVATNWTAKEEYRLNPKIDRINVGLTDEEENAGRIKKVILRYTRLRGAIKKYRPDVVISFVNKANFRAAAALIGQSIPLIVSVRNDPKVDYAPYKAATKLMERKASACVFQTKDAMEFFGKKLRDRSMIIYNPLSEEYFGPTASVGGSFEDQKRHIISAGRICEQKNQLLLIKAFNLIKDEFPDAVVDIFGTCQEEDVLENIEKYINENGLKDRVLLRGIRRNMPEEYAKAYMFVLPSDYEGMPNALMEAMAFGVPCIATDCPCGGSRMLTESGGGILVPVNDEKALADAMRKVLSSKEYALELAKAGANIRKVVNPDAVCAQWMDLIEKVRAKNRK